MKKATAKKIKKAKQPKPIVKVSKTEKTMQGISKDTRREIDELKKDIVALAKDTDLARTKFEGVIKLLREEEHLGDMEIELLLRAEFKEILGDYAYRKQIFQVITPALILQRSDAGKARGSTEGAGSSEGRENEGGKGSTSDMSSPPAIGEYHVRFPHSLRNELSKEIIDRTQQNFEYTDLVVKDKIITGIVTDE